jgi:hypothetical protein
MDIKDLEELKKQAQALSEIKAQLPPEELATKVMEIYDKLNEALKSLHIE